MKQFKWFNANRGAAGTTSHKGPSSKLVVTISAGLLMTVMGINGCSKAKSKEAAVNSNQNNSNPSMVAPTMPTAVPAATSTPQVTHEAAKPKKAAKKRPSTVTYNDSTYGISFQYPRKYTLKTGDKAKLNSDGLEFPVNFVKSGGVAVAAVELPGSSYLGTDFYSAFFSVNVNKNLTSEQCEQFAPAPSTSDSAALTPEQSSDEVQSTAAAKDVPVSPLKVSIHGTEFSEVESAVEKTDTKYFHVYQGGSCYEFALGMQTAEAIDGIEAVNRDEVFAKLEKILATVKIKSEATPEVVASTTAHAASEGSH